MTSTQRISQENSIQLLAINSKAHNWLINTLSSVKLTIILISSLALFVLLGAWCPQISQVGQNKVVEQFGDQTADLLIKTGIADIFHSSAFLALIALLTINIIAGSFRHVFPKLKLLRLPMPFLSAAQIANLPLHKQLKLNQPANNCRDTLIQLLKKKGYQIVIDDNQITAQSGKYGRLAPTITHIGLLLLLSGVIISSLTGFSGLKEVIPGGQFSFTDSQHAPLWFGQLPKWSVKVNESHREDYPNGEAKQWYSDLSIVNPGGKILKSQTISVNEPLSYDGIDIYQSNWSLKAVKIRFNNQLRTLDLQPMGKLFAAFLPLPDQAIIIFSLRDQKAPLRIFAKRQDWPGPKLIAQIPLHKQGNLGDVSLAYEGTIPQTGLQYKCDPGIPIVYLAFFLIIAGISLAAVPHRQLWVALENHASTLSNTSVTIGGTTKKGKLAFEKQINQLVETIQSAGK